MINMLKKKSGGQSIMMRIASLIVDKRKAFFLFFILACLFCFTTISKVKVNDDLTKYLPESTETRRGVDIMDREFETFGNASILVTNITYDRALALSKQIGEIEGVDTVKFYDKNDEDGTYDSWELTDYYKNTDALMQISFTDVDKAEITQSAIAEIRTILSSYDSFVYTTVDKDDNASLQNDMKQIMVMVLVIIVGVLLFTSKTYMEILIFLLTFGVAAVLNMGTNYWFVEVSFITNAVGTVLQLALAIDYAIILFHRYMEEREHGYEYTEAMKVSLSKAIPEIASSSLTTIAGMVALMLMQFTIGMDLGRVLAKAIIFSLISVFLFMPSLIVMFHKAIEKTGHRNFVPRINYWGKFVVRTRYLIMPLFILVLTGSCFYSLRCHYIYDVNSVNAAVKNEYMSARDRINETFDATNTMAIVVPKGNYHNEAKILSEIIQIPEVKDSLGIANVEVGKNKEYTLVDSLTAKQFAEIADVDIDTVSALYAFYAYQNEGYGYLINGKNDYKVSIIDMVDFIYDQKEKGNFNLDDDLSADIDDIHEEIANARRQLEGDTYDRLTFTLKGAVEGEETYAAVDKVRAIAQEYYDEVYVVGDPTSDYDLSTSFSTDNKKISILTALFVGIILLFTFQSAGIPVMLVLTIQGSIWINFALPYLQNESVFFLCYLIVSSIQMGATIDYAIVITNRYLELKKTMPDKKAAIIETLNQTFPTIVTSGSILTCAGFVIGYNTSNPTISSLGVILGRGTLISIILVMTVLPQILLIGDKIIEKTAFTISVKKNAEKEAEHEEE